MCPESRLTLSFLPLPALTTHLPGPSDRGGDVWADSGASCAQQLSVAIHGGHLKTLEHIDVSKAEPVITLELVRASDPLDPS